MKDTQGRWAAIATWGSLAAALLYWCGDRGLGLFCNSLGLPPPLLLAGKAAAILLLLVSVVLRRRPYRSLLAAGLVAHSAGDVVLDAVATSILPAMGFFLVGHLAYLALFSRSKNRQAWGRGRIAAAAGIALIAIGALAVLLPEVSGALTLAVPVYVAAIGAMAVSAQRIPGSVAIGAWAYLISDALIGWSRFVGPIGWAAALTWPLYYLAQFLITRNWRS